MNIFSPLLILQGDFNFVAEEFPEQCSVRRRSDKLEGLEILSLPSFRVCPGDVGDEGGGRGAGLLVGRLRSVRRSPDRRLTGDGRENAIMTY